MIIARQKKRENIAEYVIYMWQLEDLFRSYNFDMVRFNRDIVEKFDQPAEMKTQMYEWYSSMMNMMKSEGIEKSGHLLLVKNIVNDINELHLSLMRTPEQIKYNTQFYSLLPVLAEFRAKSNADADVNDVELCFNAVYETMLLKMQGRTISEETQKAVQQISHLLAVLAQKYKEDEDGKLKLVD